MFASYPENLELFWTRDISSQGEDISIKKHNNTSIHFEEKTEHFKFLHITGGVIGLILIIKERSVCCHTIKESLRCLLMLPQSLVNVNGKWQQWLQQQKVKTTKDSDTSEMMVWCTLPGKTSKPPDVGKEI